MSTLDEWLTQIEDRAAAATPGPWAVEQWETVFSVHQDRNEPITGPSVARCDYGPHEGSTDAEFIAHSRTDVEDMVKALRAVLEHRPTALDGNGCSCGATVTAYMHRGRITGFLEAWFEHLDRVIAEALGVQP